MNMNLHHILFPSKMNSGNFWNNQKNNSPYFIHMNFINFENWNVGVKQSDVSIMCVFQLKWSGEHKFHFIVCACKFPSVQHSSAYSSIVRRLFKHDLHCL